MLLEVSFCFQSLVFKDEIPFLKLHLYMLKQTSRKMWQYEKCHLLLLLWHTWFAKLQIQVWFLNVWKNWDSCLSFLCLYYKSRKKSPKEELGDPERWCETPACWGRRITSTVGFCCFSTNRVAQALPSHKFNLLTSKEFNRNPGKEKRWTKQIEV